jgi:hypothetical protein
MKFLTFILLIAFMAFSVQALPEAEPNPGPNPKADPKANPFFFPFFRFGREGGWEGGWGWGRSTLMGSECLEHSKMYFEDLNLKLD